MNKISLRFIFNAKRSVNVLTIISLIALTLSIMAMLVVLCVMAGFEDKMRERLFYTTEHVVFKNVDKEFFETLKNNPLVLQTIPRLSGDVLVELNQKIMGATLKGIDTNKVQMNDKLSDALEAYELEKGTLLNIRKFEPNAGLLGPLVRDFYVPFAGVNGEQHYEKETYIFVPLDYAKKILKSRNEFNEIEVRTNTLEAALDLAKQYSDHRPYTWLDHEESLFYSLKLERISMSVLLSLIVLVASFTIISCVGMGAMEKVRELGILRCLGLSQKDLMKILHRMGLYIGSFGILVGLFLGIAVCIILKTTNIVPLPAVYVDRSLPILIKPSYILGVMGIGFLLTGIAASLPARFFGKTNVIGAVRG